LDGGRIQLGFATISPLLIVVILAGVLVAGVILTGIEQSA
jgi:hypothetical protein